MGNSRRSFIGDVALGKVLVEAKITNLFDTYLLNAGSIRPEQVRSISVPKARVDLGITTLALPTSMIEQLGLVKKGSKRVRTASGVTDINLYDAVYLLVQGRKCTVDVMELLEGSPVLIGQIPLELFDFVIDMRGQRLIGNPDHGGEQILDLL